MNHWAQPYLQYLITSIDPLFGGFQHNLNLLTLTDGSLWVCKEFKATNWLGEITDSQLKLAQSFSLLVADELGFSIPSVFVHCNQTSLKNTSSLYGIIYPYCAGEILESITEKQAYLLGHKLAQVHALSTLKMEDYLSDAKSYPLIEMPEKIKTNKNYSYIEELVNQCNTALIKYSNQPLVLSHRDLNLSNIVWKSSNEPYFIDWENTGLIHPIIEVIGLALNCAKIPQLNFDLSLFRATLRGYKTYNKTNSHAFDYPAELWVQSLHSWLLWYVHCVSSGWEERASDCLKAIEKIQLETRVINLDSLLSSCDEGKGFKDM